MSTPTVFAAFSSKVNLLKSAIDIAIAGDAEPITMGERPIWLWVNEAGTAEELLARYAVMMGEVGRRASPIYDVLIRWADSDPELVALLTDLEHQRLRAAAKIAEAVKDRGGLPEGRTLAEARDVVWICNAPEVYTNLTAKRHWSTKRYVAWARDTLTKLVLEPPRAVS